MRASYLGSEGWCSGTLASLTNISVSHPMRTFALVCKFLAIVYWLAGAWFLLNFDVRDMLAASPPQYREAPLDWGTPAYYRRTCFTIAQTAILSLLALTPNRILVCSRFRFGVAFALALVPLARVLFGSEFSFFGVGELIMSSFVLAIILGMFSPLPLSLLFSFIRRQKGETISYA